MSSTDIKSVGKVHPNLKAHIVQKVVEHVWSTHLSTFTCSNQMLAFVNWKYKAVVHDCYTIHTFASFFFISFHLIFFLCIFKLFFFLSADNIFEEGATVLTFDIVMLV